MVVSRCSRIRVLGGLAIHTGRRVLRTQSFSRTKSIVARRVRVLDIFGIFSRKGKSCCHVHSMRHNGYTSRVRINSLLIEQKGMKGKIPLSKDTHPPYVPPVNTPYK